MVKQQQREGGKESKRERKEEETTTEAEGKRQKRGFVRDSKRGITREKQQGWRWMDGWREVAMRGEEGNTHDLWPNGEKESCRV